MPTPVNVTNVPTTGLGSPGDTKGMIAVESTVYGGKFYYCVKNYDGVSRIWVESAQGPMFDNYLMLSPPPAPAVTSYTTTVGNASALLPIISGTTVNGVPLTGYTKATVGILVYINGSYYNSGVVNGTSWTFQPNRSLTGGVHIITAKAYYVNDTTSMSLESVASAPFNINLVPPAPTLTLQVAPAIGGKSLSWTTTNATSVTVNGATYPASGIGTAVTYFFPTNGKSVTHTVNVIATGPTNLKMGKQITITVDPLPKPW